MDDCVIVLIFLLFFSDNFLVGILDVIMIFFLFRWVFLIDLVIIVLFL